MMRRAWTLGVAMFLGITASVLAGGITITLFPDGTDSIGIPDEPYRGTCLMRCERAKGYSVSCTVAQRFGETGSPVDCATHCRNEESQLYLPLPENGQPWRHANTGWCWLTRRTDTGELFYPACHSENYQYPRLAQFGPGDSECFYPDLPAVPFEYVDPTSGETAPAVFVTTVVEDQDGDDVEIAPSWRFGGYTLRKIRRHRGRQTPRGAP